MSALMDIGRRRKSLTVEGKSVEIGGVSASDLFTLAQRFPPFLDLLQRRIPDPQELIKIGPTMVGAMIAAAFGTLGNDEEEKHAATLDLNVQLDLLIELYDVTFPGGVGPFVQKVSERFGINLAGDDQPSDEIPTGRFKSASPSKDSSKAKAA